MTAIYISPQVPSVTDLEACSDDRSRIHGSDLRQFRRVRAAWAARLLDRSGKIVHVTVCDVSEGGIGLLGQCCLPVGTGLDVTLSVPDPRQAGLTQAVPAKVRVMHASFTGNLCRLGVSFVALPMSARLAIRTYVLRNF